MKKYLLLLLISTFAIGQTNPTKFANGIQITGGQTTDNLATKVNVQNSAGVINTIAKSDLIDVIETTSATTLPVTGVIGKVYVTLDNNKIYRWNGTIYQELAVTNTLDKENAANKQNSLAVDGTGVKFPTVDAVNAGLATKGTVTSITGTNGVTVATGTTTPVIGLGAITPTSTNGVLAATMAFNDATSSIQTQLNDKQPSLGFTPESTSNKNIASGYAGLGSDGKLISSQLPSITISDTFVTASQAAMLAVVAETGDVAVRTDLNKSFILKGTNPAVLTDWQELLTPTSAVTTVFGRNGAVTAQTGDYTATMVGAPSGSGTSTGNNTGDQDLSGKVDKNTSITGATSTKITYDSKGLVTGGAGATTADVAPSTGRNYVTDAKLIVVNNTSGANTGDNSVNSLYSGLVSNATHTGDATGSTGSTALTVVKINGTLMSGLATGILKNTTTTGVPSIAIASDFPTLDQNTTGTASNITGTYGGSISLSQVTTGLGFTPYNSTNPSGFISSVPAQTFASLTGKPTTLGGYGITDAIQNQNASAQTANMNISGIGTFGKAFISGLSGTTPGITTENLNTFPTMQFYFPAAEGSNRQFNFRAGGIDILNMSTSGSTFSSSVTATDGIFSGNGAFGNSINLKKDAGSEIKSLTASGGSYNPLTFLSSGYNFNVGAATFYSSVTASGFFQSSDRRLKNITKRDGDVAYFKWKDGRDNLKHIGYIAQEVRKEFPDQVKQDDKGMLSVNYIEVLVAKIQDLEKRLNAQDKKIKKLQKRK